MLTGHCHCGQITYEAQEPIVKSSYCDCAGCRRATGTLRAPYVTVMGTGLRIKSGQPAVFRASSGDACDAHGVWTFCPHCGTQLFWKPLQGDQVDILAGTLDDASVFQPPE